MTEYAERLRVPALGCATDPALVRHPEVRAALDTPGRPLDAEARRRVEPVLGSDFSAVRVHTDTTATRSAALVGARAYTVDRDIVFGAGQYAPATTEGRALIAHELGHVGAVGLRRQPVAAPVRPPDVQDQRVGVEEAISFLSSAARFYEVVLPSPTTGGEPGGVQVAPGSLERILTGWGTARDTAATTIDTLLAGDRGLTERLRGAYRDAVTALLAAAARDGRRRAAGTAESPAELLERHRALIHEWAWPAASVDPHGTDLLARLETGERGRLREVRAPAMTPAVLDSFFRAGDGPPPAGTPVVVAAGTARIRAGLSRLASAVISGSSPTLPVDSVTTMSLDLGRYGGDRGLYRFTHVRHPAPRGREVLVEHAGSLGTDGRTSGEEDADKRFDRLGFVRAPATTGTTSWSDAQFALLLAAIAQMPESMLGTVRGIRFVRVPGANPDDPKVAASYDGTEHGIRVYDPAFVGTATPVGIAPDRPHASTVFDRLIAHEIGHALDLAPTRGADQALRASVAVRDRIPHTPVPGRPGRVHVPAEQRGKWNALRATITRQRTALGAVRSLSGERHAPDQAGVLTPTESLPSGETNAFRDAAAADGTIRLTAYSDKSIKEHFAEAFSFYVTDPALLARLRPHVFAYFARTFPDAARPGP